MRHHAEAGVFQQLMSLKHTLYRSSIIIIFIVYYQLMKSSTSKLKVFVELIREHFKKKINDLEN